MNSLADLLEQATGHSVQISGTGSVGGGCIHNAQRVETNRGRFFVKKTPASRQELLRTEATSLNALSGFDDVRFPEVVAQGLIDADYVLVLEWMDLRPLDADSARKLGASLAQLHQNKSPSSFGWEEDNFIGLTPQPNPWTDSWPEFFRDHRLLPQIELASRNGHRLPSTDQIIAQLDHFFDENELPSPSPLHGDLWGGNAAQDESGNPVLFDPAFYYGDPETDIAFSRYFGGFDDSFYEEYSKNILPRPGWKMRETLYNLYHVLNHLNLFGSGYLAAANRMITDLQAAATDGEVSE